MANALFLYRSGSLKEDIKREVFFVKFASCSVDGECIAFIAVGKLPGDGIYNIFCRIYSVEYGKKFY